MGNIDLEKEHEAFERVQASKISMSYEDFKKRIDEYEEITGNRYGLNSINEKSWHSWIECAEHKQTEIDELKKQLIEQGQRFNEQSQVIADLKHKLAKFEKSENHCNDSSKQIFDENYYSNRWLQTK